MSKAALEARQELLPSFESIPVKVSGDAIDRCVYDIYIARGLLLHLLAIDVENHLFVEA